MDLVEGEGEVLCHFNDLSLKVFEFSERKRQERLLLFLYIKIVSGVVQPGKVDSVFPEYLFPEDSVQIFKGIKCHILHIDEDMHVHDLDVAFDNRLPFGRLDFCWSQDSIIVLRPRLEILIKSWSYPVPVLLYRDFTVV